MAQQLTRAGEQVPLVVILDTPTPEATRAIMDEVEEPVLLAHLAREQAVMAGKEIALTADDLRPLDPEARVVRALEALREQGVVSGDIEVRWVRALLDGAGARAEAAARYEPRPYDGRIVLFQPNERDQDAESLAHWNESASDGWRALSTEPVEVHAVPGHHATLAGRAHAAGLAKRLRAVIDQSLSF
jgi:thioesterase domain-containing protein